MEKPKGYKASEPVKHKNPYVVMGVGKRFVRVRARGGYKTSAGPGDIITLEGCEFRVKTATRKEMLVEPLDD